MRENYSRPWFGPLIMLKRAICIAIVVVVLGAILRSLVTGEMVYYEHGPSQQFFRDHYVNDPDLRECLDAGTLFTVGIVGGGGGVYIVHLGVYYHGIEKDVIITKATIGGNGYEQQVANAKDGSMVIKINPYAKPVDIPEVTKLGDVVLFKCEPDFLKEASSGSEPLRLRVFYEINGRKGDKEYIIVPRAVRQIRWPT